MLHPQSLSLLHDSPLPVWVESDPQVEIVGCTARTFDRMDMLEGVERVVNPAQGIQEAGRI
jgi:hypothetical protein